MTEPLSRAVGCMEFLGDTGTELLKLVLSEADYNDERDVDNLLFVLHKTIKHFILFHNAGEAVKVVDLLAEEKLSFTELRYADGEKTNLRIIF